MAGVTMKLSRKICSMIKRNVMCIKLLPILVITSLCIYVYHITNFSMETSSNNIKNDVDNQITPPHNIHVVYYNSIKSNLNEAQETNVKREDSINYQVNTINNKCITEKRNVYLMKAHKTGSTTVRNILQRFTMKRNLTMPVFMKQHTYPSRSLTRYLRSIPTYWRVYQELKSSGETMNSTLEQYLMDLPEDIKVKDNQCNILAVHTVFVKQQAMKLFKKDVTFISTLRHPLYQMISAFGQWNLAKRLKIPDDVDPFEEFLRHPEKYDLHLPASLYNPIAKIENLTLSYTRNYIAYEFGFDLDRAGYDKTYVKEYLAELNATFSVVIFTDLFTESLVLLKREMCWTFQDIVFIHLRKNSKIADSPSYSDELLKKHRKWTYLDYGIYDMFRSKHKNLVKQGGTLFQEELEAFESVLEEVTDFCTDEIAVAIRDAGSDISKLRKIASAIKIIKKTMFSEEFVIEGSDCVLMSLNENKMWVSARVQKYPQLCDQEFDSFITRFQIQGGSKPYCLDEEKTMKYNVPYELMKGAFWKT